MARPSRNSCTAYALKNYSQKDVLNVQVTEVSVHAVLDCSSVMWWMVVHFWKTLSVTLTFEVVTLIMSSVTGGSASE